MVSFSKKLAVFIQFRSRAKFIIGTDNQPTKAKEEFTPAMMIKLRSRNKNVINTASKLKSNSTKKNLVNIFLWNLIAEVSSRI